MQNRCGSEARISKCLLDFSPYMDGVKKHVKATTVGARVKWQQNEKVWKGMAWFSAKDE